MEQIYRILGISASISEKLSRTRGNGIPMNWLVMFLFGMFGCFTGYEAREGMMNGRAPVEMDIATILLRGDVEDKYVRSHGQFVVDAAVAMGGGGKAERVYVPLMDVGARRAIYVEVPPDKNPEGLDSHHVTGMVRSLNHDLKNELGKTTPRVAEVPIDVDRMIEAGAHPSRPWIWVPATAMLWGVAAIMLVSFVQRYVVFRRMEKKLDKAGAETNDAGPTYVTGRFMFGPKDKQRFYAMPSAIAELDGGLLGLVTQTNASIRFMGSVTRKREGVWMIPIRAGTLGPAEFGRYYFGRRGRPAFRVRFVNDASGKREWAILAFNSARQLEQVHRSLVEWKPTAA